MTEFIKFYRWGSNVKFHMAMYCLALLFFHSILNVLNGIYSVEILTLFQMFVTCFIFAIIESFCFPLDGEFNANQIKKRTLIWFILANIIFIGASICFKWFTGINTYWIFILIFILEAGLIAMWFAVRFIQYLDTRKLNEKLYKFQNK